MTEADFCARIRTWAEAAGFTVYPEVCDWDLVLVVGGGTPTTMRMLDLRHGDQIGIQAKLRANCDVLQQALPTGYGPEWRFVAAPKTGSGFRAVAERLGIGVIESYERDAEHLSISPFRLRVWPNRIDSKRLKLPSIASRAIVAGVPCPRQLSTWRENALRFIAWARQQPDQIVRSRDLRRFGLAPARWHHTWLTPIHPVISTCRWRLGGTEPLPDVGYEDVAAELAAASGGEESTA